MDLVCLFLLHNLCQHGIGVRTGQCVLDRGKNGGYMYQLHGFLIGFDCFVDSNTIYAYVCCNSLDVGVYSNSFYVYVNSNSFAVDCKSSVSFAMGLVKKRAAVRHCCCYRSI